MTQQIIHYTDFKSPFAFIAFQDILRLEDTYDVDMIWRYYTLDIADFIGPVETRTEHYWRKVKYMYMDARRLANERGLTLYGPQRIFKSEIAGIGMYWAEQHGVLRPYASCVFERFFKRDIDLDEEDQIAAALSEVGAPVDGFSDFLKGEGKVRHDRERAEAEDMGIFGVPSLVLNGEIFWGSDRLWMVEERLKELGVTEKGV